MPPSSMLLSLGAFAGLVLSAQGAVPDDEVKSLPGFDGPLPSKHYSGYIPVRRGEGHNHYYLQLSENDPENDPIVLWSNGGPGCTSLKGAFEELGQLVFNRDSLANASSAIPKLFYNPLGWTRFASMLYFEHPTGVGFSFCNSCVGNSSCSCFANDTTAAEDNYDALIGFFGKYPEFRKNDFYITGESYAGIYIPMLMAQIKDKGGIKNLKGAAIGNGCTGNSVGACGGGRAPYLADLYYGKGMYSASLYKQIQATCSSDWDSDSCLNITQQMNAAVGPHNFYNLDDFCPGNSAMMEDGTTTVSATGGHASFFTGRLDGFKRTTGPMPRMDQPQHAAAAAAVVTEDSSPRLGCQDSLPLGAREKWCGVDSAMMRWLEVPAVKAALHVALPQGKGTERNNLAYYKGGADDLTELYKELALAYRMWIYNGQEDACVPYNIMEDFTNGLGFEVKSPWHAWFGEDNAGGRRVAAGYATQYGGKSLDLAFITIKGAGHEVPTYKPAAAFHMFANFLNGTAL